MSTRRAFIVDLNRCTGCHACEMACQIANDVPAERRWRRVRTFNEMHVHEVENLHLSLACNHCAEAPCMAQCPARAYSRDEATGAVLIDGGRCVGCRYCAWVCPYGAPRFDEANGVMAKCDFCVEKQHAGGAPACVAGCPTGALSWGELAPDELVHEAPGFASGDADPSIRIEPLKPGRLVPRQTEAPSPPPWRRLRARLEPLITFAHEWTLAVFTLLMAVLVGWQAGEIAGGPAVDGRWLAAAAAVGMALSASHLGRRGRAWRAGLNAGSSWLSREIVLAGGFCFLAAASERFAPAAWLAVVVGAAALWCIDRVYAPAVIRGAGPLHSAHTVLTGLLIAAIWSGSWGVAYSTAGVKTVLYAARHAARLRQDRPGSPLAILLRLGQLTTGLWLARAGSGPAGLALVILAEMIDRAGYYDELEIPGPESLQLDELDARPQAAAREL